VASAATAVPRAERLFDQVLKRTPDAKHGAVLYETCAACHGSQGQGVADGSVPAIGGQPYTIVAKQLVDFRTERRKDVRMQHFADTRHLAYSQHVADVSAYIASLPPPQPRESGTAEEMARGARVYAQLCERCHGVNGRGREDWLAPRLAAQHPAYLSAQLDAAEAGRRLAMTKTHASLLESLSEEDVSSLITWLAATGVDEPAMQ